MGWLGSKNLLHGWGGAREGVGGTLGGCDQDGRRTRVLPGREGGREETTAAHGHSVRE